MGAMHHEQEYDANPTAGLQDPGANASIAAFSSNRSLANLVASDGENKWRKALEMSVPAIVVLKCACGRSRPRYNHTNAIAMLHTLYTG